MKLRTSKLRVFRVIAGKSQTDLAYEAGVTQPYISLIETHRAIPTEGIREKLAVAVGVEVEDAGQLFIED